MRHSGLALALGGLLGSAVGADDLRPVELIGADDQVASLGLVPGGIMPRPVCGRWAVPGYYHGGGPDWFGEGLVENGVGTGPLSIVRGNAAGTARGWQALWGTNTYSGSTTVTGPAVLDLAVPLSTAAITLGRRSLLCLGGYTPSVPASTSTGSGTTELIWTSQTGGAAGNAYSVRIIADATAGTSATAVFSGSTLTVTRLASATATTVAVATRQAAISSPVWAYPADGTGSGIPDAVGPQALAGGVDGIGPYAADWTPVAGTALTYIDPPAVLYARGAILSAERITVAVAAAPPLYPVVLIEAAAGISGAIAAGPLPPSWRLRQTADRLYLEPIP